MSPRTSTSAARRRWQALFAVPIEGAVENTGKIAEMCNLEFTFGKYHLPEFKLPEGYDSFSYLKKLCDDGYRARYGDDPTNAGPSWSTSRT